MPAPAAAAESAPQALCGKDLGPGGDGDGDGGVYSWSGNGKGHPESSSPFPKPEPDDTAISSGIAKKLSTVVSTAGGEKN